MIKFIKFCHLKLGLGSFLSPGDPGEGEGGGGSRGVQPGEGAPTPPLLIITTITMQF